MKLITKISVIILLAFALGSCTKYAPLEKVGESKSVDKKATFIEDNNDGKDISITDPENEDDLEDVNSSITDPENEDDIEEVN